MPRSDDVTPIVLYRTRGLTLRWMLSLRRRAPRPAVRDRARYHADEKHPIVLTRTRASTLRRLRHEPIWGTVAFLMLFAVAATAGYGIWLSTPAAVDIITWVNTAVTTWVDAIVKEIQTFPDWFFGTTD